MGDKDFYRPQARRNDNSIITLMAWEVNNTMVISWRSINFEGGNRKTLHQHP